MTFPQYFRPPGQQKELKTLLYLSIRPSKAFFKTSSGTPFGGKQERGLSFNSFSPLDKKSVNTQSLLNFRKLSGGIKNYKIKNYKNFTFEAAQTQNISKKESFFQYLFVQYILSESVKTVNVSPVNTRQQLQEMPKKLEDSSIKKKTMALVLNEYSKNILNFQTASPASTSKKNSESIDTIIQNPLKGIQKRIQNKILINYKKPFFCYWLLPFLGLVSVFPTFVHSSGGIPLGESNYKFINPKSGIDSFQVNPVDNYFKAFELFKKNRLMSITKDTENLNNANLYATSFPEGDGATELATPRLKGEATLFPFGSQAQYRHIIDNKNKEHSLFLSSGHPKNIDGERRKSEPYTNKFLTENQVILNNLLKSKQKMDSLFLSNLQTNVDYLPEVYEFKGMPQGNQKLNYKFLNYSLAILNKNTKLNSNLNWYWHTLFLNSNTYKDLFRGIPKGSLAPAGQDFFVNNTSFFPSKLFLKNLFCDHDQHSNQDPFKQNLNSQSVVRGFNPVSQTNENLYKKLTSQIKLNNPQKVDFEISSGGIALGRKKDFNANKNLNPLFLHSHMGCPMSNNNYFVGILKKTLKKDNGLPRIHNKKLKMTDINSPYRSIKKALLLIDQALFQKNFLNSGHPKIELSTFKTFDLNSNSKVDRILGLKKTFNESLNSKPLEKTLNIIFKNKNYPTLPKGGEAFSTLTGITTPKINVKALNSVDLMQSEARFPFGGGTDSALPLKGDQGAMSIMQVQKKENILFKKDILYNAIFEGLNRNLHEILNNKNKIEKIDDGFNLSDQSNMNIYHYNSLTRFTESEFLKTLSFKRLRKDIQILKKPQINLFSFYKTWYAPKKSPSFLFENKFLNVNILKLNHQIRGGNLFPSIFKSTKIDNHPFRGVTITNAIKVEPIEIKYINQSSIPVQMVINQKSNNLQNFISEHPGGMPAMTVSKQNDNKNVPTQSFKNMNLSIFSHSFFNDNSNSFNNRNSFLFLSNYIDLLTQNLKKFINPYKLRLTYFPEINVKSPSVQKQNKVYESLGQNSIDFYNQKLINHRISSGKQTHGLSPSWKSSSAYIQELPHEAPHAGASNLPGGAEKIFLSYLSKAKKPSIKKPKTSSLPSPFGGRRPDQKSSLTVVPINLKNLKYKSKLKLQRKIHDRNKPSILINTVKQKIKSKINKSAAQLLKTKLFISFEINDLTMSPPLKREEQISKANKTKDFKSVENKMEETRSLNQISKKFIDILKNKKNLKIKRRLKKMKKETRRRKKRKIFYPRPTWIKYSLYKNFLKKRHSGFSNKSLGFKNKEYLIGMPPAGNSLDLPNTSNNIYFSPHGHSEGDVPRRAPFEHQMRTKPTEINKHALLSNTKNFYRISNTVFSDLKRILMKSNWLRSYLNPYLEKVKNIYKEMQNSSKKMEFFTKIRSYILSLFGFSNLELRPEELAWSASHYGFSMPGHRQPIISTKDKSKVSKEYLNSIFLNFNEIKNNNSLNNFRASPSDSFGRKSNSMTISHKRLGIIEYNRIVYQRIQRIILSIKENLNLNGEIKNRSKKLGKNIRAFIKRDYKSNGAALNQPINSDQNSSFWSKIFKNNILKVNSYISYGYNELSHNNTILNLSKNNLYWAFNKTNMSPSGSNENLYNYPKKLWEIYKTREISKSNKTKKIIFDILMKYSFLTNSSKSLDGYNHILEQSFKDNISNIKMGPEASPEKVNNENNTTGDFSLQGPQQQTILLPLKTYTLKSEQKLTNIENKLKLLGLYSKKIEKTYKNAYFRSLKQQLTTTGKVEAEYAVIKRNGSDLKGKARFPKFETNREINTPFSSLNNYNKISNNYSYWWSFFQTNPIFVKKPDYGLERNSGDIPLSEFSKSKVLNEFAKFSLFDVDNSSIYNQKVKKNSGDKASQLSFLSSPQRGYQSIFSMLFHFCTLVSFISLGGVKTLIKFYYILISKISKFMSKISLFELFKPSIVLNDLTVPMHGGPISDEEKINLKSVGIASNHLSAGSVVLTKKPNNNPNVIESSKPFAKLFFLQCIISRNRKSISMFSPFGEGSEKESIINSTNLWYGKSYINKNKTSLNKGWTSTKTKNNKFLQGLYLNQTTNGFTPWVVMLDYLKDDNIRSSYLNSYFKTSALPFGFEKPSSAFSLPIPDTIESLSFHPFGMEAQKNNKLSKYKMNLIYYSLLKISNLFYVSHKISFSIYLLLLKSVDLFAVQISFIFKFLEKPGEYVVESIAYNFLVEWSADLITTIPDTVDISFSSYFSKLSRQSSPLILFHNSFVFSLPSLQNFKMFTYFLEKNSYLTPFLLSISNSILKRLLNSTLFLFIQQLCEPDSDYINREKKGTIYWDIWGDYLNQVAEENSINIYELTTDKEEQIKLLSKYEEILSLSPPRRGEVDKRLSLKGEVLDKINFKFSKLNFKSTKTPTLLSLKSSKISPFGDPNLLNQIKLKLFSNPLLKVEPPLPLFLDSYIPFSTTKSQKKNNFGWSVSQFLSYQGKDTDLFIDLHPPKSFSSIPSLKYSYSMQQPIGSIVCQIFSGIFYKQISKNILVVGAPGFEKSLLIQAMAGETELKIITDNASRYAMVYRGVAVGIKLLRDVFEALSVHTPCIFLMEDIHAIGERRPFLIDESSATDDSAYNKNQSMQEILIDKNGGSGSEGSREVLYRSSKHLLSHYKKAYKEPKSLATNHFSFTFLFVNQMKGGSGGAFTTKIRNSYFKPGSAALPIQVIKKENENKFKMSTNENGSKTMRGSQDKSIDSIDPFQLISPTDTVNTSLNKKDIYSSALEIKTDKSQFLAPPASSPFSILILKEEKKLKYKKLVKDMPWFGLPGEQFSLVSKYNYSIRIKVALLADLVLSNLSVKLDMITDLLVIIDSVKGNRGFVVFATTHVPYILDPALRRPGRFDETINLPLISKLFSRWSNYRYNVKYLSTSLFSKYSIPLNSSFNKGITLDLFKSNFLNLGIQRGLPLPGGQTSGSNELINYLTKKNSIFTKKVTSSSFPPGKGNKHYLSLKNLKYKTNKIPILSSLYEHMQENINPNVLTNTSHLSPFSRREEKQSAINSSHINLSGSTVPSPFGGQMTYDHFSMQIQQPGMQKKKISNKQLLKLKSKNYSFACKSLISLLLFCSPNSSLKWISMLKDSNILFDDYSIYLNLFGYPLMLKIILMSLIGGKIGETFVLNSLKRKEISHLSKNNAGRVDERMYAIENSFLFNFDNTWKQASSLLFSYLQKRQCSIFNKNVSLCGYSKGVHQLLSFNNRTSLMEAPSPPISNVLLPSKRYENYKKTFNTQYEMINNQNFFNDSISEKLQLHQQQRLLKRLYKFPIKEFFKSEILSEEQNKFTNYQPKPSSFNNSYLTLAPLEKTKLTKLTKLSSINWSYKNILYNRHRTSLTNQWWNGQQGEHNAETTFLSDIDWRYTFVPAIGDINIDFPDAEQFYNPRNRRWFLTNGDWNYWFDIQSEQKDIYYHYIYDCFTKAYKYLNKNREIIDFYAEILHQVPSHLDSLSSESTGLNEREFLNLYKRFKQK